MYPFPCILSYDAERIKSPEGQLYLQAWAKRYEQRTRLVEPFVPNEPPGGTLDGDDLTTDNHCVVLALTRSDTPSRPETYGRLNTDYLINGMGSATVWVAHALRTLYALPAALRRVVPAGPPPRLLFSKAYFRGSQVMQMEDGQICLGIYCYGNADQLAVAAEFNDKLKKTVRDLILAEPVMTAVSSASVPPVSDAVMHVERAALFQGFGEEGVVTYPPFLYATFPSQAFLRWYTVAQSDHPALWEYCVRHVLPAATHAKEAAEAAYAAASPEERKTMTRYSTDEWLSVPIWLKDMVVELAELQVSYEVLSERSRRRTGAEKQTDLPALSRMPKLKYRLRLAEVRFAGLRGKESMPKFPPIPLGAGSKDERKQFAAWKRPAWAVTHEDLGLPVKKVASSPLPAAAEAAPPSPRP